MLRIRILGTAEIEVGDQRILPGSLRKFALLLRLAADPGQRFPRTVLCELIYADLAPRNALHSLRDLLYQLRQSGVELDVDASGVALMGSIVTDVGELIDAPQPTLEQLRSVQLGLLPAYSPNHSESFAEWLDVFRRKVSLDLCRILSKSIVAAKTVADWSMTEQAALACLALDPAHEEATLGLAEALAASGSKARALDLLEEYTRGLGAGQSDLKVTASVVKRRISDRIRDRSASSLWLPFVGRTAEMVALNESLALAQAGQTQCVVVAGDAGIGKSRLADEFCTQASLQGARIERVAIQPHDLHRPMGVFVDLVPRLLKLPGALGCAPESMAALRRLTGLVTTDISESDLSGHEAIEAAIRRAISDLLDAVAAESLLVLCIDDVQWIDSSSKSVLVSLASAKHQRRLISVLTTRDRADQSFFGRRAERLLTLSLRPLPETALDNVLEQLTDVKLAQDQELRSWMASTSGGNPFYLRSLITHFQNTQERFVVPSTLNALLEQQLVALSSEALSVLSMTVALGRHADLEHLISALEIPHVRLQGAVRELESHSLLTSDTERIEPAHWLIAEALNRRTSAFEKRLVHRRVAEILERQAETSESSGLSWECAEHWILAGDRARACAALESCANKSVEIGRPREAAEVLLRAATLLDGPDQSTFLEKALRLADAATEFEILLRGLEFAQQNGIRIDDEEIELAAVSARIAAHDDAGDTAVALRKWLRPSAPLDARVRAATSLIVLADQDSQPALAKEAYAALVDDIASGSPGASLLIFSMIFHSRFGNVEKSLSIAENLLVLANETTPIVSLDIRRKCAIAFYRAGRTERATRILEEALISARALRAARVQFNILSVLVGAYADAGRTAEYGEHLRAFNELAAESEAFYTSFTSVCVNAEAACIAGRPGEARRWIDLGRNQAVPSPTSRYERYLRVFAAWADELEGKARRADTVLVEMTGHHAPGLETGDLSDTEIAIAVKALAREKNNNAARELIVRYVSDYRRVPGPLNLSLREAALLVDWHHHTPPVSQSVMPADVAK